MTDPCASAPGKIMLAGEYAVIDGAEAVMMAVDRRAVARVAADALEQSPFLAAAAAAIEAELGAGDAADRARRVVVDSSALRSGEVKLGLGSSAAATVAAVGCALAGDDGAIDRALAHRLAHRAHRAAQSLSGAAGSGADVACSVWGGVIVVRLAGDPDDPLEVRPIHVPAKLELVPVWTGVAADTATLVDQVRALRTDRRGDYDRATTSIADAVHALLDAFTAGSACKAIGAVAAGGEAVARLGAEAGVDLESDVHRKLRRLAERLGGAVKPTGAGAGDLALAAFDEPAAAAQFRSGVEAMGMLCPALRVDHLGLKAGLVPEPAPY